MAMLELVLVASRRGGIALVVAPERRPVRGRNQRTLYRGTRRFRRGSRHHDSYIFRPDGAFTLRARLPQVAFDVRRLHRVRKVICALRAVWTRWKAS
jgi:hypothetical protein